MLSSFQTEDTKEPKTKKNEENEQQNFPLADYRGGFYVG